MAENVTYRLWEKIKTLVDTEIDKRTRSCCRMKKMTVTSAYSAEENTVGLKEAFGNEIFLPVYGTVDTGKLAVGTSVWVIIPHSSMSNALVMMLGDGSGATAGGGGTVQSVNSVQPDNDGNITLTGENILVSSSDEREVSEAIEQHDNTVTTMTSEAFEALTTDEKAALFASGVRVIAVDGDLDPDDMTDMQRFAAFLNPIGSIVHFDIPTSPATLWGFGTWEAVAAGRVLVGAGTADSGTVYTAGETGGEETHTLAEAELPKLNGTVEIHGGENGSNYWSPSGVFANSPVIDEKYKTISSVIKSASSLSHFVFDAGGDQPHNNMQPYYVCYIWRRIA